MHSGGGGGSVVRRKIGAVMVPLYDGTAHIPMVRWWWCATRVVRPWRPVEMVQLVLCHQIGADMTCLSY